MAFCDTVSYWLFVCRRHRTPMVVWVHEDQCSFFVVMVVTNAAVGLQELKLVVPIEARANCHKLLNEFETCKCY